MDRSDLLFRFSPSDPVLLTVELPEGTAAGSDIGPDATRPSGTTGRLCSAKGGRSQRRKCRTSVFSTKSSELLLLAKVGCTCVEQAFLAATSSVQVSSRPRLGVLLDSITLEDTSALEFIAWRPMYMLPPSMGGSATTSTL